MVIKERKNPPLTQHLEVHGSINKTDIQHLKRVLAEFRQFEYTLLDLEGVDFVDTGFINFLVSLRNEFGMESKKIKILNPHPFVMDILTLTHVHRLYDIVIKKGQKTTVN